MSAWEAGKSRCDNFAGAQNRWRWRSCGRRANIIAMSISARIADPNSTASSGVHYEQQYLDLMRQIWAHGHERVDRTGVGTRSIFGATMRFSLADNAIPLLTTKRVFWKVAAREMLWFLSGDTSIRPLVAQGVHIWTDWPLDRYRRETGDAISMEDFEARILADEAFSQARGKLGPVYGKQCVNWPH